MRTDPHTPASTSAEPESPGTAQASPVHADTLPPDRATIVAPPAPGLLPLFRQRWQSGRPTPVEEFFAEYPAAREDPELALDLIYAEFVLRQEQGTPPEPEAFLGRFPTYRPRLEILLSLDRALLDMSLSRLDSEAEDGSQANYPSQTLASPCLEDGATLLPGDMLGKYPIVAPLGQGGQARIFRALHPTLHKDVVLKLSRTPFAGSRQERDCLVQEGRLLAQLDHPHLARVHDLDFYQGYVYLVMEYIPGRTLSQWLQQQKPDPAQAARLLAQVARALAVAHNQGVTHCDLTPRNVLVDAQGLPHVIDFGLARLRHAWGEKPEDPESISGTLPFLSPEQARGQADQIGPRTDLFALGAVLYFALTGKPLYQGADWPQTLEMARRCAYDRQALHAPAIPKPLARLCLRLLAEDPAQRPASADALADELEAFARPSPHKRQLYLTLGAAALLLALVLAWGWWNRQSERPPEKGPVPASIKFVDDGKPRLTVKVRDGGKFFPLPYPLENGQEIYFQARIPARVHASLFLFTSEGALKPLADWPASSEDSLRRYPPEEDRVVPVIGKSGTEVLLLVGRAEGPVSLEALRSWWGEEKPWPTLPPETAWRMRRESSAPLEKKREVGKPTRGGPDPEAQVESLLEGLRWRLKDRVDVVEALAFPHGH